MLKTQLPREAALPFELELVDGKTIRTVGDVERYLRALSDRQMECAHWEIATRMLANAMREPAYLKAATLSLQTALMLDGLLVRTSTLEAGSDDR